MHVNCNCYLLPCKKWLRAGVCKWCIQDVGKTSQLRTADWCADCELALRCTRIEQKSDWSLARAQDESSSLLVSVQDWWLLLRLVNKSWKHSSELDDDELWMCVRAPLSITISTIQFVSMFSIALLFKEEFVLKAFPLARCVRERTTWTTGELRRNAH